MADKGFVGMCDVELCAWNENNDCKAPAITVEKRKSHADCDTFLNEENPWSGQEYGKERILKAGRGKNCS